MAFLTDSSLNNLTVTSFGDVSPSTSVKKFGTASAYFGGDGDFLSVNSEGFAPGTGAMTIEMWVNFASLPDNDSISGICGTLQEPGYAANNSWWLGLLNQGGTTYLNLGRHGDGQIYAKTEWSPNTNTWYYVAAVKQESGDIRLFVDGVSLSVTQSSSSGWAGNNFSQTNFCIGVIATPAYFNGYIDDLRVTKGIARYTSNFTPPTAAFPNPSQLIPTSGLSLWLKADAGVTTSGSNVTAWADQSGNGNTMTAEIGAEPLYAPNGLNGKPVIDFNNSKYLTANVDYTLTAQTSIAVFKYSSNSSTYGRIISQWDGSTWDFQLPNSYIPFLKNEGNEQIATYAGGFKIPKAVMDGSNYIAISKHNGSQFTLRLNGGNEQSGESTLNTHISKIRISASNVLGSSDFFNSKIAEVIIYNREITGLERQQIESYLNAKYAIY